MSDYNYHSFTATQSIEGMDEFRHILHVGDRVPDFDALTPDGEPVKLFDHLRSGDFTVLEFGSLT
jgi:hypothetical protein